MKILRRLRVQCLQIVSILIVLATFGWMSSAVPCWGQANTGTISGTVTDSTGAVIPQAAITATNTSTGVASSTTADSSGHYSFLSLPAGSYNLSAVHPGFDTLTLAGISLRVYQQITQDVVLKVGTAKQTVTVEAAPTLVDTTNASLGTTVNQQAIVDMPLNLREVGSLALLVPGTVNTTGRSLATGAANGSGFNDFGYSGSGGGSGGNLLLIDGMISRAINNSSFSLDPPPEMVHEFKIQNNVYDASFGMASGTFMNLITNSGTNQIHGSAWEFARNSIFDASGYFSQGKPALSRNQFGGAIGGPIIKDKIFYFGSYEGLRLTQGQISSSIVPTAAQKSGDFSSFLTGTTANLCASSGSAAPPNLNFDTGQLFDPATEFNLTCPADPANPGAGQTTVLVGTPIPGNKMTTIDPVAQKVLALFPSPNTAGVVNYTNQSPKQQQNDQFDGRVDATVSKINTIFVRYLLGNSNITFPGALPAFNGFQHFRGQNLVGGWTRVLGPSTINDVRIGYQRDYLTYTCQGCPRPAGTLASFGIAGLTNPLPQFNEYPNMQFQNFPLWGDGFPGYYPVVAPDTIEQYEDTFTKVIGRHTLALGANLDFWQTNGVSDPLQANGLFTFNGQYSSLAGEIPNVSSVSDLADLELGYPAGGQFTKNAIITNLSGGRWISLFAQDNFRLSPRFNVQYGLRWEYRRQPMEKNNRLAALFPLSNCLCAWRCAFAHRIARRRQRCALFESIFSFRDRPLPDHDLRRSTGKGPDRQQSPAGELRTGVWIFRSSAWHFLATPKLRQISGSCRRRDFQRPAGYKSDGFVCQQQPCVYPDAELRHRVWRTTAADQWRPHQNSADIYQRTLRFPLGNYFPTDAQPVLQNAGDIRMELEPPISTGEGMGSGSRLRRKPGRASRLHAQSGEPGKAGCWRPATTPGMAGFRHHALRRLPGVFELSVHLRKT